MNKIGIIFAMKEELDALKEYLEITNEYKIFELNFYYLNYYPFISPHSKTKRRLTTPH